MVDGVLYQQTQKYTARLWIHIRLVFFLSGSPLIQKNVTEQKFEYLFSWVTKRDPKTPPTFFRWQIQNLEMMPSMDLPGMPTSSVVSFHNVDSILVHWCLDVSQDQQVWACELFFWLLQLFLESDYPHKLECRRKLGQLNQMQVGSCESIWIGSEWSWVQQFWRKKSYYNS